ncbi:MAG: triose-phosphate isomerase [Candidatus Coatesbacteria bacterium 4484_99]|uniref:Triosephosphate isomerase n=1 Tax=Candidatus Coatesbacteria bacterium 4484_99 TaxID=1970774 RepID=A0A1W9S1X0_9BACT|nr:MAG: triose-phosphate isomerase [Candidatus Coatesbacteria bacterium 4484_99]
MRRKIIVGNWKMNLDGKSVENLITGLVSRLGEFKHLDVGVAPPFVYLPMAVCLAKEKSLAIAAQNCYPESRGAFTGEISPPMLADIGVDMCIVGHSERRRYFNESNEFIARKVRTLIDNNIKPILCVGEKLEERDAGETLEVVGEQVRKCLSEVGSDEIGEVVLAYEPVWAIGTGRNATPEQAEEVHRFIRGIIGDMYGEDVSSEMRIMYGGSVKPDNAYDLIAKDEIDGALVGGASLALEQFVGIISKVL